MKSLTHMVWLIVIIAGISFLASERALSEITDSMERWFQVSPGGRLTFQADLGSIEVRATDADTLKVEVIRKVFAEDREEVDKILKNLEVTCTQRGDDVNMAISIKKAWFSVSGRRKQRLNLLCLISVPGKYSIDLKTSGGSISVDDIEGEVRGKTSGGSLHFGDIEGPVWGRTSGGSITLAGCMGAADLRTSGGSINIGEVDGKVIAATSGGSIQIDKVMGSVNAKTSAGSITVEEVTGKIEAKTSGGTVTARISGQPKADSQLSTSGGSVVVYLADNIAVDVDAKTSGGRIKTDFPVTVQEEPSKDELKAKINGGGPKLLLHTSGGSIYLRRL